jgi:hypothetical protein
MNTSSISSFFILPGLVLRVGTRVINLIRRISNKVANRHDFNEDPVLERRENKYRTG